MRRFGVTEAQMTAAQQVPTYNDDVPEHDDSIADAWDCEHYVSGGLDHVVVYAAGCSFDFTCDEYGRRMATRWVAPAGHGELLRIDAAQSQVVIDYVWQRGQEFFAALQGKKPDNLMPPWMTGRSGAPCGRQVSDIGKHISRCKQCHDALHYRIGRKFTTKVNSRRDN